MPLAQVAMQSPAGQAPATKGVVLKGKAPVSNEVLKVKLPRPQEADLPNGIHLMILEDHRVPQIAMQMLIPARAATTILPMLQAWPASPRR
jgi:hypothetical protein